MRQRLELAPPAVTSLMVVLLLLVTAMMPSSASAAGPCRDGEIVLDGGVEGGECA